MLTNNSDLIYQRMTDEPMSSSQTRITTSASELECLAISNKVGYKVNCGQNICDGLVVGLTIR